MRMEEEPPTYDLPFAPFSSPAFTFPASGHKSSLAPKHADDRKEAEVRENPVQGGIAKDPLRLLDLSSLHPDFFQPRLEDTRFYALSKPLRDKVESWYAPGFFYRRHPSLESNSIPHSYHYSDPNDNEVSVIPDWDMSPEAFGYDGSWSVKSVGGGGGKEYKSFLEEDDGDALTDFLLGYNTDPEARKRDPLIWKRREQQTPPPPTSNSIVTRSGPQSPAVQKTVNYRIRNGRTADPSAADHISDKMRKGEGRS